MLSPEVRSKLDANQSDGTDGPITRDMLPADVLADLNRTCDCPADDPTLFNFSAMIHGANDSDYYRPVRTSKYSSI